MPWNNGKMHILPAQIQSDKMLLVHKMWKVSHKLWINSMEG